MRLDNTEGPAGTRASATVTPFCRKESTAKPANEALPLSAYNGANPTLNGCDEAPFETNDAPGRSRSKCSDGAYCLNTAHAGFGRPVRSQYPSVARNCGKFGLLWP